MLEKFWKIILNANKVWGVELLFKHRTRNCMFDFWFTFFLVFFKKIKTLDKKLSSLECSGKANVYWQELTDTIIPVLWKLKIVPFRTATKMTFWNFPCNENSDILLREGQSDISLWNTESVSGASWVISNRLQGRNPRIWGSFLAQCSWSAGGQTGWRHGLCSSLPNEWPLDQMKGMVECQAEHSDFY